MKFILCILTFLPFLSYAGSAKVHVKLNPAGDFTAATNKVRGFIEKIDGSYVARDLSFAVGSLDSQQDTRNDHMWKELGGKTTKVTLKGAKGSGGKGQGMLVVKGISKPVEFTYKENGGNIMAKFPIKFSNYGIKPSFLGVGVEDMGEVEATIPVR